MNGANFYTSWNRKIQCYYLPCHLRHTPVYLGLLKELDKNKMSLHDLTFITFTLLLVANSFCAADKNETLSSTIDSQNVTSSEVSATLLEHINTSGKFFTSFQIIVSLIEFKEFFCIYPKNRCGTNFSYCQCFNFDWRKRHFWLYDTRIETQVAGKETTFFAIILDGMGKSLWI